MTLLARRRDQVIVREVQGYRDVPMGLGDTVLDLGANIGASARLFLDRGARKVIAVEPDPGNYALARRNLRGAPATVLWAAVGAKPGRLTFFPSRERPYLSSHLSDVRRKAVKVPCVTLGALLATYRPDVVKCDIEFGEYDLPELHALPECVLSLAIELHVRYDLVFAERRQTDDELLAQRQKAADLVASFARQGFGLVKWKEKLAKDRPVEDRTGLHPLVKSVDGIWTR